MAGDKNKKGNDKKGQAGSRQASVQRQSQARQERDQSLKRRRFSSEGTDGSDCDPEIILDALIGNLGTDDNLLERFVTHLLRVPNIQQKIVSHVSDMLSNNTTGDQLDQLQSSASQSLQESVQELTSVVSDLKNELESSHDKFDDLGQYSRRNNIRIAGIPENDGQITETLVCNTLNQYLETPILPTEIDRCHRIFRPTAATNIQPKPKPKDIIVKFVSYKSKASLMSKIPMEKLRADNESKPFDDRIYVSDDITRTRSKILFMTRKLKKTKRIKDTYARDGRILIKTKTDRVFHVTTEKELDTVCKKNGIKLDVITKPGERSASPMVTGDMLPVSSQLNPNASLFRPDETSGSQSVLQSGATPM